MPLYMRLPKRGFVNVFRKDLNIVSLGRLQSAVDKGLIDPAQPVTVEVLVTGGVLRRPKDGVRVLADGTLSTALKLSVHGASKAAIAAVESVGGSVEVLDTKRHDSVEA